MRTNTATLKTANAWCFQYGIAIVDDDGWRKDNLSLLHPITFKDFVERIDISTIEIANKGRYKIFCEITDKSMKTKEPATKTSPAPELIKYLRDENNNPRGVVLAKVIHVKGNKVPSNVLQPFEQEFIGIGWSRCSVKDSFDKEKGLLIARGRAQIGTNATMHPDLVPIYEEMKERAVKYFQGKRLVPWV